MLCSVWPWQAFYKTFPLFHLFFTLTWEVVKYYLHCHINWRLFLNAQKSFIFLPFSAFYLQHTVSNKMWLQNRSWSRSPALTTSYSVYVTGLFLFWGLGLVFWNRLLICSPGWAWTHHIHYVASLPAWPQSRCLLSVGITGILQKWHFNGWIMCGH